LRSDPDWGRYYVSTRIDGPQKVGKLNELVLDFTVYPGQERMGMKGDAKRKGSILRMALHIFSGVLLFMLVLFPAIISNFTLEFATKFGVPEHELALLKWFGFLILLLDAGGVLLYLLFSLYGLLKEIFHE
jgi:hypothetical protein